MASHTSTLPFPMHNGALGFTVYAPTAAGQRAAQEDAHWHRVHSVAGEDDDVLVTYRDDGHYLVTLADHRDQVCYHLASPTESQRRAASRDLMREQDDEARAMGLTARD